MHRESSAQAAEETRRDVARTTREAADLGQALRTRSLVVCSAHGLACTAASVAELTASSILLVNPPKIILRVVDVVRRCRRCYAPGHPVRLAENTCTAAQLLADAQDRAGRVLRPPGTKVNTSRILAVVALLVCADRANLYDRDLHSPSAHRSQC